MAARAVTAMLMEYGFSAKRTAGWGVVRDEVESGSLTIRGHGGALRTHVVARVGGLADAARAAAIDLNGKSSNV